ncbi:MAG: hypothetical protein KDA05_01020 [Phycisphaerales bacterium]|nr:hypothetical protein [Phycisphaerales bacterium]MCB9840184.1 hypothetical protein [Phycisphaeraceae bacterium]
MDVMIGIIVLCVVIGVPGTLLWWKIADQWADAEHKRFPVKKGRAETPAGPEPTVVEMPGDEAGR